MGMQIANPNLFLQLGRTQVQLGNAFPSSVWRRGPYGMMFLPVQLPAKVVDAASVSLAEDGIPALEFPLFPPSHWQEG